MSSVPVLTHWRTTREIPGHPGYRISDIGDVFSLHKTGYGIELYGEWHRLKSFLDSNGYLYVNLCKGKAARKHAIHRLVLLAFVGECPEGKVACHCNGFPLDNSAGNLRWDTYAANSADRKLHGTGMIGELHHQAKLSWRKVRAIRNVLDKHPGRSGATNFLSRWYSVSRGSIHAIKNNLIWKEDYYVN